MFKGKKWIAALLCGLMVLSMAACGAPTESTNTGTTDTATEAPKEETKTEATEAPKEEAPKEETKDLIKVSTMAMEVERMGNNPKTDVIKEKFGIEFEYYPITWGDWNEKMRTAIATDDAPDIIWWDLKGGSSNEFRDWARQGAFKEIPATIFDSRPNMKKDYEGMASMDSMKVDGKLFAWPRNRGNAPESRNVYESWFHYRRDWAQAVGLYKEGDEYTWDEWKALVKAVIEKDPAGDGTTVGMVMPPWAFPHAAVSFLNSPAAEGNESCSYIKVDGKYVWPPMLPEYKANVIETQKMYQDGLIWRDNLQAKSNEDETQFKGGFAFARYGSNPGTLNSEAQQMITGGIIKKNEDIGSVIVNGMDGTFHATQTEDYWTVIAFNHKVEDAKMERVFDMFEWLVSDEGKLFRAIGIEGKDYEKNADGTIKCLWPFDEATGTYVSPYAEMRFGNFDFAGAGLSPNPIDNMYGFNDRQKIYDRIVKGPTTIKEFDYKMSFFSAPNKDKFGTFGMDVKTKVTELIVQTGDIGKAWDDFVASMMPQVQPILDELNAMQ